MAPTAAISARAAAGLCGRWRELRDGGGAILFVSHKLEEVFALCDRITVIRDGETILDAVPSAGLSQKEVVTAMVGRSISLGARIVGAAPVGEGPPRLALRGVSTDFGHVDVDLAVAPGEVVGLYGLVGAGRTELARAIVGLDRITAGSVLKDGQPVRIRNPGDALHTHRIGYVSEDRKGEGLILQHPIRHNVAITIWDRVSRWPGLVTPGRERAHVSRTVDRMSVRLTSLDQPVGQLSGGNQQKISVAKWLASDVDVLIIDEPTIGIDVRTKEDMYAVIESLKELGKAVLVISSDLPEIVRISDRIVVMAGKRIVWNRINLGEYERMSEEIMHSVV